MGYNFHAIKESVLSYNKECQEISLDILHANEKLKDYYKELNELKKKFNFKKNILCVKNENKRYEKKNLERTRAVMVLCLCSEEYTSEKYYRITEFLAENFVYVDVFPADLEKFMQYVVTATETDFVYYQDVVTIRDEITESEVTVPLAILDDNNFFDNLVEMYEE